MGSIERVIERCIKLINGLSFYLRVIIFLSSIQLIFSSRILYVSPAKLKIYSVCRMTGSANYRVFVWGTLPYLSQVYSQQTQDIQAMFTQHWVNTSLTYHVCYFLTVSSSSSPSFFTWNGHQPLTRLCLNRDIMGTLPSVFNMPSVHCFEDLAPRGNRFKSRVRAPAKLNTHLGYRLIKFSKNVCNLLLEIS